MADLRSVPSGLDGIETPAYVYDLDEIRRAHRLLRSALPVQSRLFYSLKANPHLAIVGLLHQLGCDAEVCSPGELSVALEAGIPAGRVLYTGPGKRDQDVAEALKRGVGLFSVDSPRGLEQVGEAALGQGTAARCLLRVNQRTPVSGQGLAMTGVASQFGADSEWVLAEPERFASQEAAEVVGYHLYLGSNLDDEDALLTQFATSIATARRLADASGSEPALLNLGGGFAAPFARDGDVRPLPGLSTRLGALLDDAFPGWRRQRPAVAFESGRYLTATAGSLLTRVLDVKESHGRPVLVLDSGINHLGGMSGLRRLPPIAPDLWSRTAEDTFAAAIVAGPLCTPLDTWTRSSTVPAVRPGDVVRVPNVGAYGLYASLLAFLGHPAPLEVLVDRDRVVEVSRLTIDRRVTTPSVTTPSVTTPSVTTPSVTAPIGRE